MKEKQKKDDIAMADIVNGLYDLGLKKGDA